jgi:RNA polymerase sigma-70 factor (ECF subfamily)
LESLSQPLGERSIPAQPRASNVPDLAALTRRMAAGDEAAYRVFYDAYFDRLSRYLLVVTSGNEEAAREALQATLHRVVRHIRGFDDEAVFWSWLTVLARTAHADERRKRRRYRAFLERFMRHAAVHELAREPVADDGRLGELLEQNVQLLPADERELLEWKYADRQSVRDIAERLATTEKAVESHLGRIRRKLKTAVLTALRHER